MTQRLDAVDPLAFADLCIQLCAKLRGASKSRTKSSVGSMVISAENVADGTAYAGADALEFDEVHAAL